MSKPILTEHQEWLIKNRIACPEAGYPLSEARFESIEEFNAYWDLMDLVDGDEEDE